MDRELDRELLERLQRASQAYFRFTDDVDAMHLSDVLRDLLDGDPEKMLAFYEKELA